MTKRNTPQPPTTGTSRRDFLKGAATTAAAGAGFWVLGRRTWAEEVTRAKSPNEKVNVASIGVGGKGDSDSEQAAQHANMVAICDVDEHRLATKAEKLSKMKGYEGKTVKQFTDFRQLLDKMGKEIDAVTISTPDHQHFFATQLFIQAGKHAYTQKPLTHDVWEARQLRLLAEKHKVATQMGNQGTASSKLREGVEVIRAGLLGNVSEVHIWTNRPIWPQAPGVTKRPDRVDKVPEWLHWDEWIGTAPMRPFASGVYHDFKWRGWWDFGTGALGDMGCHTANLPFMALKLGHPSTLKGESEELNSETYPGWARVNYEFPERQGMSPVKVTWYEGHKDGILVHPPKELAEKVLKLSAQARAGTNEDHGEKGEKGKKDNATGLPRSGSIIVGDKGIMYSPHDYGGYWELLPKDEFAGKTAEKKLPRNPDGGDSGQKIEWLAACVGGPPALSNFDYAGMLTEFILLGNIGIKHAGEKLEWDGPGLQFKNVAAANKLLRREYRKGWEVNL